MSLKIDCVVHVDWGQDKVHPHHEQENEFNFQLCNDQHFDEMQMMTLSRERR